MVRHVRFNFTKLEIRLKTAYLCHNGILDIQLCSHLSMCRPRYRILHSPLTLNSCCCIHSDSLCHKTHYHTLEKNRFNILFHLTLNVNLNILSFFSVKNKYQKTIIMIFLTMFVISVIL
jgi:hypothetical protein